MFYFYIIYSKSLDTYYYGSTSDPEECLRRHNSNHKGFTQKACDWLLVYTEKFETKQDALSREIQIKKWKNRKRIESLINREKL